MLILLNFFVLLLIVNFGMETGDYPMPAFNFTIFLIICPFRIVLSLGVQNLVRQFVHSTSGDNNLAPVHLW